MNAVLYCAFSALGLGHLLCLLRAIKGPSSFDRVLAFDCMALQSLGMILLFSILSRTNAYIDVILVVGLLGFVGTASLAYYLERSDGE